MRARERAHITHMTHILESQRAFAAQESWGVVVWWGARCGAPLPPPHVCVRHGAARRKRRRGGRIALQRTHYYARKPLVVVLSVCVGAKQPALGQLMAQMAWGERYREERERVCVLLCASKAHALARARVRER